MTRCVIAIDGPAGAGKGTVARRVAEKLGFLYVDTGAMYRAITLKAMRENIAMTDNASLTAMARDTGIRLVQEAEYRVFLDGEDVSAAIRTEDVSGNTHYIASILEIRDVLWKMQRDYRKTADLVMEGRDIGSIVFPDAQLKVYLDASVPERAKRRYLQLQQQGIEGDIGRIEQDIAARDEKDRARTIAPLLRLPDAVYIDSTAMTIEEEVRQIVALCRQRRQDL